MHSPPDHQAEARPELAKLKGTLAGFSIKEYSQWGMYVLQPHFDQLRSHWWNPMEAILARRACAFLEHLAGGATVSAAEVSRAEEIRRLADAAIGVGRKSSQAVDCVNAFFSQYVMLIEDVGEEDDTFYRSIAAGIVEIDALRSYSTGGKDGLSIMMEAADLVLEGWPSH
jgi:hypothetical protein